MRVFWLEEERVVSEDWVMQLQGPTAATGEAEPAYAPASSRVVVRENQAGELAIHYRDHGLVFREWKAASTSLSEGWGAAPSPRPHPQNRNRASLRRIIRGEEIAITK